MCRIETSVTNTTDIMVYSQEFLNSIKLFRMTNNSLRLKVGGPLMLLGNIDHKIDLCNGTRLYIIQLANHVVKTRFIIYNSVSAEVLLIHTMLVSQHKQGSLFEKVFDLQSKKVSLFLLPKLIFFHGHMLMHVSRVTSMSGFQCTKSISISSFQPYDILNE